MGTHRDKIDPKNKAEAVNVAKECYAQGALNDLIDNAVMGGQIKERSGPDSNLKHNGCAFEQITDTLASHKITVSDADKHQLMQQGYDAAHTPQSAKGPASGASR